jgi:hypothetical protein
VGGRPELEPLIASHRRDVRSQVRAILTKLDASSQVVAIATAREVGWVPLQER